MLAPWKKNSDKHRQHIKKQRHYFAYKVCLVKATVFPVVMYGCESWILNKAECCRIDAFELWCHRRLLRFPWTARRSNQSTLKKSSWNIHWKDWWWSPILWPPDVKAWYMRQNPVAGKDWRQEEKGMKEDEMVGWHQRLNGHELEPAPGDGEGQGSLVCCSPWGYKELDMIEWLNNNNVSTNHLHSFERPVKQCLWRHSVTLFLSWRSFLQTSCFLLVIICSSHHSLHIRIIH